ncbi:uncharacterized protein [Populus alba]|uniref:H15 domain-containing protein n=2 Tax=Populus TaxID=3689 RepID=A0A4U5QKL5_POPAL|nr:atrophin-1 [Populus alba]KAJ6970021.1 atrophin-1 [Populus alba x Populus x berolinensis]TKS11274.1 hypothetical protein D5086_0000075490 [Populus alba]
MDPPPPSLLIHPPLPPSTPPPPTTAIPSTTETIPHLAPLPNPAPTVTQPSYAEMIYSAITALKEQDGSSRIAIAKYIERAYPGLPSNHSDLLTHHLKRLKNSGALVLNKKSYMVPRSDSNANITTSTPTVSTSPTQIQPQHAVPVSSAPPEQKRGRGRPPKAKLNGLTPTPAPVLANGQAQTGLGLNVGVTAQPLSVGFPIDSTSSTVKKGRGRPKKVVVTEAGPLAVNKGKGRPPKTGPLGSKKSPGRPRKPKSLVDAKKGPGRPPKNQLKPVTVPYAVAAPTPTATDAADVFNVGSPRPRGRPRKGAVLAVAGVGTAMVVQAKRPGRPPKLPVIMKPKPKKSSGRPVGRPRKNANAPWTITRASEPQAQAELHGDLKRKLEFFQSKVKLAIGVLKPHLTSAAISAVAAIQELEGLASMDINVPWREEPQPQIQPLPQPLPQIQPLPLPQIQPQPQPQPLPQAQPQPQPQPQPLQQLLQS